MPEVPRPSPTRTDAATGQRDSRAGCCHPSTNNRPRARQRPSEFSVVFSRCSAQALAVANHYVPHHSPTCPVVPPATLQRPRLSRRRVQLERHRGRRKSRERRCRPPGLCGSTPGHRPTQFCIGVVDQCRRDHHQPATSLCINSSQSIIDVQMTDVLLFTF